MKNCEFVTVYTAAIITHGDYVFVKEDDSPFLHLEGIRVDAVTGKSPKNCLLDQLGTLVGFSFSPEWLRFIGTTAHISDNSPTDDCHVEDNFVVVHYWLDASSFQEFERAFKSMKRVTLTEMSENKDNRFLCADALAANRVIELQGQDFNELQKLT